MLKDTYFESCLPRYESPACLDTLSPACLDMLKDTYFDFFGGRTLRVKRDL